MILPGIRNCSKSDHSMGDNRYSCCRSFGAIYQPLWLKNSHNMAIFHHFLTFLATFLVVTTTFMDKTCTERTQTLVTCMVGGTDPFCPSPGTYMAQGGVQKMAILGVKTGVLWRACYGVRTRPGNRFMRHITSHYMAEHVLGPFLTCPCTFMAQGGSKIWPFGG